MTQKPISEMSYQEKVESYANCAWGIGWSEIDTIWSRQMKEFEKTMHRNDAAVEAHKIVIRHVFPEPPVLPKWKSFDVLPESGRLIVVKGKLAFPQKIRFEVYDEPYLCYPSTMYPLKNIVDVFPEWMYEHEFQTLINLAL